MNTLTKEQRLNIYKRVLQDISNMDSSSIYGLCLSLYDYAEELYDIHAYDDHPHIRTLFPEFANKKPGKSHYLYWWPLDEEGRQTRIKVLQEIIKEMGGELQESQAS